MSVDPRTPNSKTAPSSTRPWRQVAVAASFASVLLLTALMPTSASGQSDDDSSDSLTPVGNITLGESTFAGAEADTGDEAPSIAASPTTVSSGSITKVEPTQNAEETSASGLPTAAAVADDEDTATEESSTEDAAEPEATQDADASDASTETAEVAEDESTSDAADSADEATSEEPAAEETATETAEETVTDESAAGESATDESATEDETTEDASSEEPAAQENATGDSDDGEVTAPRVTFPVVGPVNFTDTWGACRGVRCSRSHKGADIFGAKLAPLVAAADGVITAERRSSLGISGNMVIITTDDGWRYLYIHLNNDSPGTDDGANPQGWILPNRLRIGDRVTAGQVIGYLGDSGNAETTPAHVHFEIHEPGVGAVNPTPFIQEAQDAGRVVSTNTIASTAEQRAEHAPVVTAWYQALLKREPTDSELFAWTDRFAIDFATLHDLIADLTMSKSRRDPSGAVVRSFQVALDRRPTLNELRAWENEYRSGATLEEITGALISSEPFTDAHGNLSDEEFVRVIYRNAISTEPSDERLADWLAIFDEGGTRTELTGYWADSYSVKNSTWHDLEVIQAFRAALDRLPTDAEYDVWVGHLDDGGLIPDVVAGIRE